MLQRDGAMDGLGRKGERERQIRERDKGEVMALWELPIWIQMDFYQKSEKAGSLGTWEK